MNGLYDHLANYLFKCYMTESHALYEPDLAKALKSSSVSGEGRSESGTAGRSITTTGSGAADGGAAPKAKAKKRKNPEASSGTAGVGAAGSFMCDVSVHV